MNTEWVFIGPMGPTIPSLLDNLPVIGIDGGAHFTPRMDIWVGDADSYQEEVNSPHIFKHPAKKDRSDLALSLELFHDPHHYKFHFCGFLGGRKDHELFNLGEALTYLDTHQECQILFYGDDGKVHFHLVGAGLWKFAHVGSFSLGTLKKTLVKLTGSCHYPIRKKHKLDPLSSFGLSNEGLGEMLLENEGPVFMYFPEGK